MGRDTLAAMGADLKPHEHSRLCRGCDMPGFSLRDELEQPLHPATLVMPGKLSAEASPPGERSATRGRIKQVGWYWCMNECVH